VHWLFTVWYRKELGCGDHIKKTIYLGSRIITEKQKASIRHVFHIIPGGGEGGPAE